MTLQNIKVGTRLALGFSFALLILAATIGVASWLFRDAIADVDRMVHTLLAKERLVSEWAAATTLNGTRTIAAAESSDAARKEQVQAKIKETTARISAIQKQLDTFEKSPTEVQLYEQIARKRKEYIAVRDAVFKEKAVDDTNARMLVQTRLEPELDSYTAEIRKLTAYQSASIETMSKEVEALSATSQSLLMGLGALGAVLCIAMSVLVTRSIKSQLGGEPRDAVAIAQRIARGDLTVRIETQPGDTVSLMHAIKTMQESLLGIVSEVRQGTDTITTASSQIASGNLDLASRTEEQASSLQQTASSMDALVSTVKQNGDNARRANQLALGASEVASRGGNVVHEVVQTMGSISASSSRIAHIIGVIDGIAFQTNLLALNAAVEAARAGEQGKGFAVVATEVRGLAQRSASAAREIKALIDESVSKVNNGQQLVDAAGATMEEIVTSVRRVTEIMGEIAVASDRQASGIDEINRAIAQMDQVTQQNASLVEQAASASEAMQDQARQLAQTVGVFQLSGATKALPRLSF